MFLTVRTKLAVDAATAAKSSGGAAFPVQKQKPPPANCRINKSKMLKHFSFLCRHLIHKVLQFPSRLLHKYHFLHIGIAD